MHNAAKLDQDQVDSNEDSNQCDFSGCTQPKWKEQDGTVLDYCCKDHADKDAPNRDGNMLCGCFTLLRTL